MKNQICGQIFNTPEEAVETYKNLSMRGVPGAVEPVFPRLIPLNTEVCT